MRSLIVVLLTVAPALGFACSGVTGTYNCTVDGDSFEMKVYQNSKTEVKSKIIVPGHEENLDVVMGRVDVEDGVTLVSTCEGEVIVTKESVGDLKAENRLVISKDAITTSGKTIEANVDQNGKMSYSVVDENEVCSAKK